MNNRPIPKEKPTVTIPLDQYEHLIIMAADYESFIDMLLRTASLGYDNKLYFDQNYIEKYIQSVDEDEYNERIYKLTRLSRQLDEEIRNDVQ